MPDPEENRSPFHDDEMLASRVFERDDAEAALHLALAMLDDAAPTSVPATPRREGAREPHVS